MEKNRAAYMTALDHMEMREVPMPSPKPNEVIVKLEYVGVCGSDVHYFHDGRCGDFIVNGDFILGHECAGTIVEVGSAVKTRKVGDRVALEPGITCGQCEFCKSGKYNLCPDVVFLATPPVQGCFMNYIAFPENMCFPLPDHISTKEGAMVEPLCVGLHAASQGEVRLGDRVIILGSGCIGLVTLLACEAAGATDITVVDVLDNRLERALQLGATRVLNALAVDVVEEYSKITGGEMAAKVFETAGSAATIAQTPYLVKRGGTIVLVGLASNPKITYDFGPIMDREVQIKSVFRYRNLYPTAIAAIADGKIDVSNLISHEFAFDDVEEAFHKSITNKQEIVKAVIRID